MSNIYLDTCGGAGDMTAAKSGGKRVGYIRVSSVDQNTGRQLDGIPVDKTFEDKISGKDTQRPGLQLALDYLREGDVLVVHSMDRLARSLDDLRKLVKDLTGRGVIVEFVKENLAFTGDDSHMSELLLNMLGAVAEFERGMIKERQREGIAKAKKEGKYRGRKPALTAEQVAQIKVRLSQGAPKALVAKEFGVTRQTLYTAIAAA